MRLMRLLLGTSLFLTLSGFTDDPEPEPDPTPDAGTTDAGTGTDDGGSTTPPPSEVFVTITSPSTGASLYGSLVEGHVDDDGSVAAVEVEVMDSDGDFATETVELDANGDFAHAVKVKGGAVGLTVNGVTFTVTAYDANGVALASDSVGSINTSPCTTGQTPSRSGQTPPTWEGDYQVCGYQFSAYTLKYDGDGNVVPFTSITNSESCGFLGFNCKSRDDGSLIMDNGYTRANDDSLFSELQSVRKDFIVHGSHSGSTSLTGMYQGMRVGGRFILHNNAYMGDIAPVEFLDLSTGGPSIIQITHLPQVPQCEVERIINALRDRGWNGTAVINSNGANTTQTCN